eukprot:g15930.t1
MSDREARTRARAANEAELRPSAAVEEYNRRRARGDAGVSQDATEDVFESIRGQAAAARAQSAGGATFPGRKQPTAYLSRPTFDSDGQDQADAPRSKIAGKFSQEQLLFGTGLSEQQKQQVVKEYNRAKAGAPSASSHVTSTSAGSAPKPQKRRVVHESSESESSHVPPPPRRQTTTRGRTNPPPHYVRDDPQPQYVDSSARRLPMPAAGYIRKADKDGNTYITEEGQEEDLAAFYDGWIDENGNWEQQAPKALGPPAVERRRDIFNPAYGTSAHPQTAAARPSSRQLSRHASVDEKGRRPGGNLYVEAAKHRSPRPDELVQAKQAKQDSAKLSKTQLQQMLAEYPDTPSASESSEEEPREQRGRSPARRRYNPHAPGENGLPDLRRRNADRFRLTEEDDRKYGSAGGHDNRLAQHSIDPSVGTSRGGTDLQTLNMMQRVRADGEGLELERDLLAHHALLHENKGREPTEDELKQSLERNKCNIGPVREGERVVAAADFLKGRALKQSKDGRLFVDESPNLRADPKDIHVATAKKEIDELAPKTENASASWAKAMAKVVEVKKEAETKNGPLAHTTRPAGQTTASIMEKHDLGLKALTWTKTTIKAYEKEFKKCDELTQKLGWCGESHSVTGHSVRYYALALALSEKVPASRVSYMSRLKNYFDCTSFLAAASEREFASAFKSFARLKPVAEQSPGFLLSHLVRCHLVTGKRFDETVAQIEIPEEKVAIYRHNSEVIKDSPIMYDHPNGKYVWDVSLLQALQIVQRAFFSFLRADDIVGSYAKTTPASGKNAASVEIGLGKRKEDPKGAKPFLMKLGRICCQTPAISPTPLCPACGCKDALWNLVADGKVDWVRRIFYALCDTCDIDSFVGDKRVLLGHSIRIGATQAAAEAGLPAEVIQRLARHSDLSTTQGYISSASVYPDTVRLSRWPLHVPRTLTQDIFEKSSAAAGKENKSSASTGKRNNKENGKLPAMKKQKKSETQDEQPEKKDEGDAL